MVDAGGTRAESVRCVMPEPAAAVAERLLGAAVSVTDVLSVALGDRLGFYRCLSERVELSAAELAAGTGTVERYTREWLEQQAVTGLLEVSVVPDAGDGPSGRRFRFAPGVGQVLADPDNLLYLAPLARQLAAASSRRSLGRSATAVESAGRRTGPTCASPRGT